MSEAETLRSVAEVAIAIAGFTGIVVVFGGRTRGGWALGEVNRLWLLLSQALVVTLFSFLPILLESASLEGRTRWRVSNGLLAVATWAIGARLAFGQHHLQHAKASSLVGRCLEYSWFAAGACVSIAQLTHSVGAVPARGPFLFLLALLFLLTAAATNFWNLLIGSIVAERR